MDLFSPQLIMNSVLRCRNYRTIAIDRASYMNSVHYTRWRPRKFGGPERGTSRVHRALPPEMFGSSTSRPRLFAEFRGGLQSRTVRLFARYIYS